MSAKSLLSTLQGMSAVATKVYHAVPINATWSAGQIHAELLRTGHTHAKSVTDGCLNSLKESGLIKEPSIGMFFKEPIQAKERRTTPTKKESDVTAQTTTKAACPIEKLSAIAASARSLQKQLAQLSEDVEAVALEIIEKEQNTDAEMAKLKQLKQLLKDLG